MNNDEYADDIESRFDWAKGLIAEASKPAPRPVARIRPERTKVTASRTGNGSFRTDTNVLQVRVGDDGMAIYNLREAVGM